jgi:hypothetical protein
MTGSMMKSASQRLCGYIFFALLMVCQASAQDARMKELRLVEDSLRQVSDRIVNGREPAERFRSDSLFTRMLVRALKMPNSFSYPFDSLSTISRVYAPDSAFRVFTWQVVRDEGMHRRHGAIQMRTTDGSLKLFPLIDRSFLIKGQTDTVTGNEWWIGSIYYKVIQKKANGKNVYTLLGYDENTIRSTKKRIEVLTFDDGGRPMFGGRWFTFPKDTVKRADQSRFWIEYKKDGNARMQWDEEMDMIIFEHLIPENNEPEKKYTYIPDGDYEGFKWANGKWEHIEKVFTFKLKDGEAPVGNPVHESKFGDPNPGDTQPVPGAKPPAKKKKGSGD